MALQIPNPASELVLLLSLIAHVIQMAMYWTRLPQSMAIRFDFAGRHSLHSPKRLFLPIWLLLVGLMAWAFIHVGVYLPFVALWFILLLLIMQLVILANLKNDRMPMAKFWALIVGFIGIIVLLTLLSGNITPDAK